VKNKNQKGLAIFLNAIYLIALGLSFSFTSQQNLADDNDKNQSQNFAECTIKQVLSGSQVPAQKISGESKNSNSSNTFFTGLGSFTYPSEQKIVCDSNSYLLRIHSLNLSSNKAKLLYPFHFFW
jgi:hypothetical protein